MSLSVRSERGTAPRAASLRAALRLRATSHPAALDAQYLLYFRPQFSMIENAAQCFSATLKPAKARQSRLEAL